MDPSKPPPTAPGFSGFLPSTTLVESLVHATHELASMGNLPSLQARNIASALRRVKLLSSLFEDLRDSNSPLPPSTVLWLNELFSVVKKMRDLIEDVAAGSAVWGLAQTELVSQRFHACVRELARALDILPLGLPVLSSDARELIELLHRQAKRADLFVDPRELHLRDELFQVMAKDSNGNHSNRCGNRDFVDCKKVEEIMRAIGVRTVSDYQEEVMRLKAEIGRQAGTGGLVAISNINKLVSLITYSKSVVFRNGDNETVRQAAENGQVPAFPPGLNRSSTWSTSSSSSLNSMVINIPGEFRCPITLDLMRDPVILASGHTYDRCSIARWINSGHHTCPKSGRRLIHMALVPNYALKSLIDQWCIDHNMPISPVDREGSIASTSSVNDLNQSTRAHAVDHISAMKSATEAVRMTAEFLVGKLAMGSPDIQRQAAYELRLLAKSGMDNRRIIAEAGAIPFLVTLLSSRDPRTQENAVTALLNLSIFDNNKILIMAAGAIDAIIEVLRTGTAMEARENAAATIFSLSLLDECKVTIGARPGAITGLVGLLRDGTAVGKGDAATALSNLAVYSPNRTGVVDAGAVPLLVDLLMDDKAGITDDALTVLALLCGCGEGMQEIRKNRVVVPILVDLLRFGSPRGKENSIAVLLGLCRDGGEEMARRLLMNPRSVPSLQSMAASGSPRAKRKADALLRLLNRYCSQSQIPKI